MNELARTNDVPKKFLEHIMLDLKSQGWVTSSPGRTGGYVLSLPPERITLGQVVRHFDGILAPGRVRLHLELRGVQPIRNVPLSAGAARHPQRHGGTHG